MTIERDNFRDEIRALVKITCGNMEVIINIGKKSIINFLDFAE